MEYFKYRNYNIELNKKAKNKNMYFRVKSDATITVTCPFHITKESVLVYLDQFINKIEKKYDIDLLNKLDYQNGGRFIYLGETYIIEYHKSSRESCQLKDDKLLVYLKDTNEVDATRVIDKFIKNQAIKIFNERFELIVEQFKHIDFKPTLKVRKMSSKFGVCFYKKASITLSTILLHYDFECIDYVIVHELSHFIQPNHSKKFYYLIETYLPNYKNAEAKLKNIKISY
ncbi:putative metal-dependent hydrolase [Bacilli bacterium PM5-3]|nr:putative metal-dependent hydrolase [Bacilli bacterium PM5-3]MDH6603433.1 putative metal-dependent hydrolase [Bacilli bacterium PM5-9]